MVVISIINLYLDRDWPDVTSFQQEFFISIGSLGAAVGALISGIVVDKFGRKPLVMLSALLYCMGGFLMIMTKWVTVI